MSALSNTTSIYNVTKIEIEEPKAWTKTGPNVTCLNHEYHSQSIELTTEEAGRVQFTLFTADLDTPTIPTLRDVERAAERQGARARRETQQSMIHAGLQHVLLVIETVIEHNGIEQLDADRPFAPLFLLAKEIYEADYIHADHLDEVAGDLWRLAGDYLDHCCMIDDPDGPEADLCYAFRAIAHLVKCDAPGHWLACAATAAARADARSERS